MVYTSIGFYQNDKIETKRPFNFLLGAFDFIRKEKMTIFASNNEITSDQEDGIFCRIWSQPL